MNTNIAESARELSEGWGIFLFIAYRSVSEVTFYWWGVGGRNLSNNYQFDWVFENVWYWIHFYFNTIFAVSYIGLVVLWKEICAGNASQLSCKNGKNHKY